MVYLFWKCFAFSPFMVYVVPRPGRWRRRSFISRKNLISFSTAARISRFATVISFKHETFLCLRRASCCAVQRNAERRGHTSKRLVGLVPLFSYLLDGWLVSKYANFVLLQAIFKFTASVSFLNQCFSTGGTRPTADIWSLLIIIAFNV
jgi:hypothetical protein